MEEQHLTASLSVTPATRYDAKRKTVIIEFPRGLTVTRGSVKLFRSVVGSIVRSAEIEPAANGRIELPVNDLPGGYWHLEIDWVFTAKKYFFATELYLNTVSDLPEH